MHTEWMAATTGLAECSMARTMLSRFGSCMACGVSNSLMSAPPENALPAPVSTIATTLVSAFACASPAVTARRVASPKPLTGGLFNVITAMLPWTW